MRKKRNLSVRVSALLLTLALLLSFAAGCGKKSEPPAYVKPDLSEPTVPIPPDAAELPAEKRYPEGAVTVTTAEELLSAIAPGAVLVLDAERCNLSAWAEQFSPAFADSDEAAESWEKEHPYVRFEHAGDGMAVVVHELDSLRILAADGMTAELVSESALGDVLRFEDCTDVSLEGLTLGHATDAVCGGDVLDLRRCVGVTLRSMDLYGCGVYGVAAEDCRGLVMYDSTIRECSDGALLLSGCDELLFDGCTLRDSGSYCLIDACDTRAAFVGCTFRGSAEDGSFLRDVPGNALRFDGCVFGAFETESLNYASDLCGGVVLDDSCVFEGDTDNRTVAVNSVEGLLEAIGPATTILLEPGRYDLGAWLEETWAKEGKAWNARHEYVRIEEKGDGCEAVVQNVTGLAIAGRSSLCADTELVTKPRCACVLSFENCAGLTLMNLTAGHTDGAECAGDVVDLNCCQNVVLANTDLYGCGFWGVYGLDLSGLRIYSGSIHDCSDSPLCVSGGSGTIACCGTTFIDSEGGFLFFGCEDAQIRFTGCTFGTWESRSLLEAEGVEAVNCVWEDPTLYSNRKLGEDIVIKPGL